MIGQMNRRVTIKTWTALQDAGGGITAAQSSSYSIWAKVEQRNGQMFSSSEQAIWNYDYKVTMRYEASRVILSNKTIDYDSKRLSINSVEFQEEGNRKYVICRCSTTDANIDTSNDVIISDLLDQLTYYGIGDEDSFIADGTDLGGVSVDGDPTVPKEIRNKTVFGAYKDGIRFDVILSGTPSVLGKEVKYIPSTGQFIWSIPFEPNEVAQIDYF